MTHQTISATEFKAKCLSLLEQVNREGGTVTITKRGQVVGVLSAPKKPKASSLEGRWARMFPGMPEMDVRDFDLTWECITDPDRFEL